MLGHALNSLKPYSSMGIVVLYFISWTYNYFAIHTCFISIQQYVQEYLAVVYICLKMYSSGKTQPKVLKQMDSIYENLISNKGITLEENNLLKEFYSYDKEGNFQITLNYCKICNHLKLPRTHHCTQCKKCIAMMDHHCYFIGNCIGVGNYNIFMQFLFTSIIVYVIIRAQIFSKLLLYRAY